MKVNLKFTLRINNFTFTYSKKNTLKLYDDYKFEKDEHKGILLAIKYQIVYCKNNYMIATLQLKVTL